MSQDGCKVITDGVFFLRFHEGAWRLRSVAEAARAGSRRGGRPVPGRV